MAVALRSQSVVTYATHTNPVITAPATIVGGDVLILLGIQYVGTVTPTPPAGFNAIPGSTAGLLRNQSYASGNSMQLYGWTKVAASESGNYTITQAVMKSAYWMGCYSGVDTSNPIPTYSVNGASGVGTVSTALSVTVSTDGSKGLILAGDNANLTNAKAITGFTMEVNGSLVLLVADKSENSGAQAAETWTNNNTNGGWVTAYLVVSPPAGAASPIPNLTMALHR